ncbi:MAG: type II secretion system protein [Pseudomonadota bacterium]
MQIYPLLMKIKNKNNNNKGFTLLEMLVVLALAGLIMGIAVGRFSGVFGLDMKGATNKMASTIRYLYDLSITEAMYIRLIIDFESQSYWVEATRDPFKVARSSTFTEADEKAKDLAAQSAAAAAATEGATENAEGEEIPKASVVTPQPPQFTKLESRLLKPTKLPKGIFFKDVYVEHLENPVEDGKVAIHFFPSGRVEEAIVNFRDKDDERNYSLKINPINGTTNVAWEYRRLEIEK